MTDRELIEGAVKAAGYTLEWRSGWDGTDVPRSFVSCKRWNPLTDDGDALRLAVKLHIDVLQRFVGGRRCEALAPGGPIHAEWLKDHNNDALAATRRAITRAAAAMAGEKGQG